MTTGEVLLHWLSHVREGSWPQFRQAVAAVADRADDAVGAGEAGRLRRHLSELGHAEFFVGGTNRWRTFAPVLGGLGQSAAILTGGRTPRLVDSMISSAEREGCHVDIREDAAGPDRIRVLGPPMSISRISSEAGISHIPHLARALAAALEPIPSALQRATPAAAPINWSLRSFDLKIARWVDGFQPRTAYEYRSRYGARRYFVRGAHHTLRQLDRRRAVYAAAYLNRVALVCYDEAARKLLVPRSAPLPDAVARAAAACAASPAEEEDSVLVYRDVSPQVAGAAMVAVGQRPPEPLWLSREQDVG